MAQLVNWADLMYIAINSGGPYKVPGYKEDWNQYTLTPFFMCFILIAAFFIMNMFVGVIISAFNKEQDRLGKNFLLTDSQK